MPSEIHLSLVSLSFSGSKDLPNDPVSRIRMGAISIRPKHCLRSINDLPLQIVVEERVVEIGCGNRYRAIEGARATPRLNRIRDFPPFLTRQNNLNLHLLPLPREKLCTISPAHQTAGSAARMNFSFFFIGWVPLSIIQTQMMAAVSVIVRLWSPRYRGQPCCIHRLYRTR